MPVRLCPECETPTAGPLVCQHCGKAFEEATLSRFTTLCFAVAVLAQLALKAVGINASFLRETLLSGTFLIIVSYASFKIAQRVRHRDKPVLDEAVSAFSDGISRLLLLLLLVVCAWHLFPALAFILQGKPLAQSPGEPALYRTFREVRRITIMAAGVPFAIYAVIRQGRAFFRLDNRSSFDRRPAEHRQP